MKSEAGPSPAKDAAPSITAVVLTGNSQRLLEQCLASLSFCQHILVVDSVSKDNSVAIATAHGAQVLTRPWTHIGEQFQFAFEHVATEWILVLDSDEVCTPALAHSVQAAVAGCGGEVSGFTLSRRSWYFDRFIRHSGWAPDILYRLFRKEGVTIQMSGAHQSFHPTGKVLPLQGEILHYPYESFANHLTKLNDYAQRGAVDLQNHGVKGGVTRGVLHGIWRFFRSYCLKLGFLDGKAGFILAVHGAMYAFLKYTRMLESSWGAPFTHE